jgi:glutamate racemase
MNDSRCAPIGVFDSGIGGLSVLRALRDRLPDERFIYLGDTARLPYGTRGDDTIIRYSHECARFLIRHGAKMIVGACNTASSIAGDFLAANLPVPFVGTVEPSVSCVLRAAVSRSLWILGTEGTVRSGSYQKRLRSHLPSSCRIEALACPLFVPLAEEGLTDGAVCDAVMDLYLAPVRASAPEAVLLACTHYPLLAQAISSYLGPTTVVLDGSIAVAEAVKESLSLINEPANGANHNDNRRGSLTCLVTDGAPRVNRLAERFLGESQLQVSVVSIDNEEQ